MSCGFPLDMGVLAAHPPTVMATRVLHKVSKLSPRINVGGKRVPSRYWVLADETGRVWIDKPQEFSSGEFVMTVNSQSDAAHLADELQEFAK